MLKGTTVRIDVLPGTHGGARGYSTLATALDEPDFTGTITFRAHDDGRVGVAGLGAWVALNTPETAPEGAER